MRQVNYGTKFLRIMSRIQSLPEVVAFALVVTLVLTTKAKEQAG
jgi:alpha-D-ribose 1-methylphosphonate 5-triphosphate synthase subunit PhnL